MNYKAKRPFYHTEEPRRLVRRRESVQVKDPYRAQLLMRQGIIEPEEAAITEPQEMPQDRPEYFQDLNPSEVKENPTEDNLEALSYTELKNRAKEQGIKNVQNMKKKTLIEKLKEATQHG